MLTNRGVAIAGIAAIILAVFFLAPVVPYSVSLPGRYFPLRQGYQTCQAILPRNQIPNTTVFNEFSACLSEYRYPAYNLSGQSPLSYQLLGLGEPPYGSMVVLMLHNTTTIMYFSGANLTSVESRLPEGTLVDPAGVVKVQNVTATSDYLGILNLNVTVRNIGVEDISGLSVWMNTPPVYGTPTQLSNLRAEVSGYSVCTHDIVSSSSCLVSIGTVPMQTLATTGGESSYALEVKGYYGGTYFVYHTTVVAKASYRPSPPLLPQGWASQCIGEVNAARGGPPLSEKATLDQFAGLRYRTMVLNYNISHYGYATDYNQFFHSISANGAELYVFPVGYTPSEFVTYLQSSAPGHWKALMDSQYAQYGWYYARGPEVIGLGNCNVTEIPGPDINVPQYFEAHGCSTAVIQAGWLVIELSQGP